MGIRTRLVAAAVAAAMSAVVVGATAASAAQAGPTTPAPSGENKQGTDKDAVVTKVAARLHVGVGQLVTALDRLKQAVGGGESKADAVRAFAQELKVSVAQAEQALDELSSDTKPRPKPKPGDGKQPGAPQEVVKVLAAKLHVSAERARQVFDDLEKVNGNGDGIVKDPAFVAIARGLGITPQHLLAVLVAVKKEVVGKAEQKVPSGSPTK